MRVVIAAARFRPTIGGVETHAYELALRLGKTHEVVVLTSNPGKCFLETEVIDKIHVQRVRTYPRGGDPYISWGWSDCIRRLQPDLVIIDGYQSVISARALMYVAKRKIPSILVFHEGANANRLRQRLYPLQRRVLGIWMRRINRLVAVAPHEVDEYRRELGLGLDKIVYIPNGSDLPMPKEEVAVDPWKIVSLGRLEPQKRHNIVIEGLVDLIAQDARWHLVIVGRGLEDETLKLQAKRLGIENHVEIRGFESDERSEMAKLLKSSRVVIAPSTFETYPIAVIEAAGLGCHVIVPREGNVGVTDLVRRGIAQAVPTTSPSEVANGILKAASEKFEPNLAELTTWDQCATQFEDLINEVVSKENRAT